MFQAVGYGQCVPPPSTTCEDAFTLINDDFIDGYQCSTPDISNPILPSICGFGGETDNATFLSFIPLTHFLDFEFIPSNCQGAIVGKSTFYGIQAAISDDCTFSNPISCFIECNNVSPTPFTLSSDNFIPGREYFLMIDGCSGDLCDYTIFLTNGAVGCDTINMSYPVYSPNLDSSDIFCAKYDSLTFTAPPSNALEFQWTLDGNIVSMDSIYRHSQADTGMFELCLSLANACDTSEIYCDTFFIEYLADTLFYNLCLNDSLTIGTYTIDTAGVYDFLTINEDSCLTNFHVTVNSIPNSSSQLDKTICNGAVFFVVNRPFFLPGSYEIVTEAANGCDSTIFLELTVVDTFFSFNVFEICEGDSVVIGPSVYDSTGIYIDTFLVNGGCDSIVTTSLSVVNEFFTFETDEICEGDSLFFGGQFLYQSGIYSDTLITAFGCDSITLLTLSELPVHDTIIRYDICDGDSILFQNDTLFDAGIYEFRLFNQFGCDSIVYVDITVNPSPVLDMNEQICSGDSILFGGVFIDTAGIYFDTSATVLGCDSITVLFLDVYPVSSTFIHSEICEGDTIEISGFTFTTNGTHKVLLENIYGCDSLITLDLSVMPTPEVVVIDTLICSGDTITFNGQMISVEGAYFDTTKMELCDSITQLNIQFIDPPAIDTFVVDDSGGGNGSIMVQTDLDSSLFIFSWSTGDTLNQIDSLIAGPYSLSLTDPSGCQFIYEFNVQRITNNNFIDKEHFFFYPNPNNGLLHYKANNAQCIEIYSTAGKIVYRKDLETEGTIALDLHSGIYFFRTVLNGQILDVGRIVID